MCPKVRVRSAGGGGSVHVCEPHTHTIRGWGAGYTTVYLNNLLLRVVIDNVLDLSSHFSCSLARCEILALLHLTSQQNQMASRS